MTTDRIYGQSIAAKEFGDGLKYWRSSLSNLSASTLDNVGDLSIHLQRDGHYGALKLQKNQTKYEIVQNVKTPIQIGQYLEIKFRLHLISGAAPQARAIAIGISKSGKIITGTPTGGPVIKLIEGRDNFVSAIIGSGTRDGVDMAWGTDLETAFCGIEISGATGGEVLIEDMQINDVTGHFLSTNSDWVDIRDYGAFGDGKADCKDAIIAADQDARGRSIFIPEGAFFVSDSLSILSPIRAYGRIECAESTALMLVHKYDLNAYIEVFKDPVLALKKSIQALFRYQDHNTLDLCGRTVRLHEPLDVHKIVSGVNDFVAPRTIQNGQLIARPSQNWENYVVNGDASWTRDNSFVLTNVQNIDKIALGSLVQGKGVGREIYVSKIDRSKNIVHLTASLCDPDARQNYTFTRFQFMLDFSGFNNMSRVKLDSIDFECNGNCSVFMTAQYGKGCRFMNNWVFEVKDRAICSFDGGCDGITVESCFFKSAEHHVAPKDRVSIAISTRKDDMKIRNNHAAYFRHFAFLYGANHLVLSNHFFQGSSTKHPSRTAGIVFTYKRSNASVIGNYIDNCWIEISGELTKNKTNTNDEYGQLNITGNTFLGADFDTSFRYIKLAPNGNNAVINGLTVTNNTFYTFGSVILKRVEAVDTSNGSMNPSKAYLFRFENNSFKDIEHPSLSHVTRTLSRSSAATTWREDFSDVLPFGLQPMTVESIVPLSDLSRFETPKAAVGTGSGGHSVDLKFSEATKGSLNVKVSANLPD